MSGSQVIQGPRLEHERSGETLHLDTRPLAVRAIDLVQNGYTAAVILICASAVLLVVPITADIVLPLGLGFAAWVLTRPVRLPFHLPERSGLRDHNDPDPETDKPRIASGRDYLGTERFTGRELWQSMDTAVQHRLFSGTTGAGKTSAKLAVCVMNAIAQGSGCIYVDGKGAPDVYFEVIAAARAAGREDDVQVLSFLGDDSNTTNPFADASADMIREILVEQLTKQEGPNEVFYDRAVALLGSIAPILRWIGDNRDVTLDLERVRDALELTNVVRMVQQQEIKFHDTADNTDQIVSIEGCPREYIRGLESYLGSSGGFDLEIPLRGQRTDEPAKQHSYIEMQFTKVFTQWLVDLGHIFRVPRGDVDIHDVVMNRRILVVLLPSLKSSDKTVQGLGRYLVAMLKATMGLTLGGRLEGDYAEIWENLASNAPSSFKVVFDEIGAYATPGMNTMLAMARQLRIEFNLGLQETSSIEANLGLKAAALLGNPNTVIAMRLQDPKTGQMIEQIGGDTHVARISSQPSSQDVLGTFQPADAASIQTTKRYNWNDLRSQLPGQAVISYGGLLIHANMFRCPQRMPQQLRVNRYLMLRPPDPGALLRHRQQIERLRAAILSGPEDPVEDTPFSPALLTLLEAFDAKLRRGCSPQQAGFEAVLGCPDLDPGEADAVTDAADPDDGGDPDPAAGTAAPADHVFSDLLRQASYREPSVADLPDVGRLRDFEQGLAEELTRIEQRLGQSGEAAKQAARRVIGGIRQAEGKPSPKPEHIATHKLMQALEDMIAIIESDPRARKHDSGSHLTTSG